METPHTTTTCESSTTDHLAPLDSVIIAIESSNCAWCLNIFKLLKAHLEAHGVPAFSPEKEVA